MAFLLPLSRCCTTHLVNGCMTHSLYWSFLNCFVIQYNAYCSHFLNIILFTYNKDYVTIFSLIFHFNFFPCTWQWFFKRQEKVKNFFTSNELSVCDLLRHRCWRWIILYTGLIPWSRFELVYTIMEKNSVHNLTLGCNWYEEPLMITWLVN